MFPSKKKPLVQEAKQFPVYSWIRSDAELQLLQAEAVVQVVHGETQLVH
jgi:hypothetical protein